MTTIFVDLTDVMLFLRRGGTLTGIQRVEINALWEIMRLPRRLPFKGLVVEQNGSCHAFDLGFLADQAQFDPEDFHRRGCQDISDRWPNEIRLKQRLAAHPGPGTWRRIQRQLIKAGALLQARLNPGPLIEQGLLRAPANHPSQRGVQHHIAPQASDVYVCLRTAWNREWSTDIADRHAARGGKVVQMIHDLVPVLRTDLHEGSVNSAFGRWLEKMARCATHFVCVSQNTARDLAGYLQERGRQTPIGVTALAHEFKGQPRGSRPPLPANARPVLRQLDGQPFVICVGSVEGCSDDDLAWLYSHALFSAYPSLYEGWGLPVGESLWFGTPCLASNATSIPEVGGDLARYHAPLDLAAMTASLTWALTQTAELDANRQAIREAPLRAWRDHGRDLLQACEEHALGAAPASQVA